MVERTNQAIKDVAQENSFTYILDVSTGFVLYYDGGQDVLPLVKTKLGLRYSGRMSRTARPVRDLRFRHRWAHRGGRHPPAHARRTAPVLRRHRALPYGEKSPEAIEHYAIRITNFLIDRGCKAVVIACNTASAQATAEVELTAGDRVPCSTWWIPSRNAWRTSGADIPWA